MWRKRVQGRTTKHKLKIRKKLQDFNKFEINYKVKIIYF